MTKRRVIFDLVERPAEVRGDLAPFRLTHLVEFGDGKPPMTLVYEVVEVRDHRGRVVKEKARAAVFPKTRPTVAP